MRPEITRLDRRRRGFGFSAPKNVRAAAVLQRRDRLLLDHRAGEAKAIAEWKAPRLPIGGGALISRGLTEGPIVAQTLRQIEDQWVRAGFPSGDEFERIVTDALKGAA